MHPRWTRAAKATARFILLMGGLTSFGVGVFQQMRWNDPAAWATLGLLLVCLAALFYDPENPPDMKYVPPEEPLEQHNRRVDDA